MEDIEEMVRLDGKIPKYIKDKAREASKAKFGRENITMFIVYLIKNYKLNK